ncbi:hypothetical protein DSO57_1039288 [Entomophthora muscae]|uniref:Uncharacterized protein n=1 Tax=Entomophthora muscae TaxID=34485 RepID=A0ACC2SMM0_9FUNG|nr:hypothetical protein DSO57_1039288 [Entomophthora muscae]
MRHLGSFKKQFKIPFPNYKKATTFNVTDSKSRTLEKDTMKKPVTGSTPLANNANSTHTCTSVASLATSHRNANIYHLGHKDIEDDDKPAEEDKKEDGEDSQVTEKTLTASSNDPSPTIDPEPTTKDLPEEDTILRDPESSPEHYLPDEEEVKKTCCTKS